jgi:hypothetical protein
MPALTPSALPPKQFLLRRLLLLSRLLIYSSSHCAFRRPLLPRCPPVSMTALPPLLLLQYPDASCHETLTLMLVSNASFWQWWQEEAGEGGEHNNQPKEGRAAKIPAPEATQQATTSQCDKRTRGQRNNDDHHKPLNGLD